MSYATSGSPNDERVRHALGRVLASDDFAASDRARRLLDYIVAETLAGRSDRIKAYTLATDVFERGADFDPQADPVVRLEASRLRRALEHYYLTGGRNEVVRISIPKGSYVPAFEFLEPQKPAEAPAGIPVEDDVPATVAPPTRRLHLWAAGALIAVVAVGAALFLLLPRAIIQRPAPAQSAAIQHRPTIFVMPFDSAGESEAILAYGLTLGVISDLTRFNDLFVFAAETSYQSRGARPPATLVPTTGIDYIVRGNVSAANQRFRSTISLVEARSGRQVWSSATEGSLSPSEIFEQEQAIASEVARSIAQPYGVIFSDKIKEIVHKPPESLTSYECVLAADLYRREDALSKFPEARACLERTIAAEPYYSEAYATLSLLYSDGYRIALGKELDDEDRRLAALDLAQRAIKVDPHSSSAFHALHTVYWQLNDVDRSFDAAAKGLALNPNNTQLLASLGARRCLRGDWASGLPLLQQAFARNPALTDAYRYVFFLDYYRRADYRNALLEASQINLPDEVLTHVFQAMAYAVAGHPEQTKEAVAHILALAPHFPEHAVATFKSSNVDPTLIDQVVRGLAKAGLEVR